VKRVVRILPAWFHVTWNQVVTQETGTAGCASDRHWRLVNTAVTRTSDVNDVSDQRGISSLMTYTV